MKILILNDVHFGIRNDSPALLRFHERFFDEVFFPAMEKHDPYGVFFIGDVFDKRKSINFNTLQKAKEMLFDRFDQEAKCEMRILPGNHDCFYKNTIRVNSPELLVNDYHNINVYCTPLELDECETLLLPWICEENHDECMSAIENSKMKYCMGHFEMVGFPIHPSGTLSDKGLKASVFKKFKRVFSGHYHVPSKSGNITYTGAPIQMTWADYGGKRGFTIFDTDTTEETIVETPFSLFHKVEYDDSIGGFDPKKKANDFLSRIEAQDTFLKVIVANRKSEKDFDKFMDVINEANFYEVKIIEDMSVYENEKMEVKDFRVDETATVIERYIDGFDLDGGDKSREGIKSEMKSLYVEGINME